MTELSHDENFFVESLHKNGPVCVTSHIHILSLYQSIFTSVRKCDMLDAMSDNTGVTFANEIKDPQRCAEQISL